MGGVPGALSLGLVAGCAGSGVRGIASYHSRILRARELAERAVAFYEKGLARIEDRWAGSGETGERFDDPHHVYAADLDLFGKGSLFQLLSTARTRMGEDTLAQWLLSPSPVERIRERHAAVDELRDQLDLREDLAVLGEDVGVGVHPEALLKWAESPNQMKPLWLRWLAPFLAVLAVAGAVVWAVWGIATLLLLIVVIEAVLTYRLKKPLEEVLHGTEHAFHDLDLLSGVLGRVEAHAFPGAAIAGAAAGAFVERCARFPGDRAAQNPGGPDQLAAQHLCADHRRSTDVFRAGRIRGGALAHGPWQCAAAVGGCHRRRWKRCSRWRPTASSIPTIRFRNLSSGAASFDGEELGHPLVPAAVCVRNHVEHQLGRRGFCW